MIGNLKSICFNFIQIIYFSFSFSSFPETIQAILLRFLEFGATSSFETSIVRFMLIQLILMIVWLMLIDVVFTLIILTLVCLLSFLCFNYSKNIRHTLYYSSSCSQLVFTVCWNCYSLAPRPICDRQRELELKSY